MDLEQARASFPLPARTAVARIAWLLCGFTLASIAGAVALSVPTRYDLLELSFLVDVAVAALVGGLISSRRPANPVGWFVAGYALCFALGEFTRQYAIYGVLTEPGALPFARAFAWPTYWIWFPGLILLFSLLPLYFPNGRLLSPRWRPVVWLAVFVAAAATGMAAIQPSDHETLGIPNPLGMEGLPPFAVASAVTAAAWLGVGAVSAASLVARFRRSRGEERQQIKWFAYAVVLVISYEIVNKLFALWVFAPAVSSILGAIFSVSLWAAVGVAVLKHRLYDIDLIINRTLVYGALTACVVGIYVLVVGYLGALFQARSDLLISLLATGLVAVVFAPLRNRLQCGVNHLMYGDRDDPYAVLSRLGQRLAATLEPRAVLPAVVETVAQALKLPYAAIALKGNGERDGDAVAAAWGSPVDSPLRLPLAYRNEPVGALLLAPRAGEESFSAADRRLLEDLARQAGVAAHAVRLTADLQRARERLVSAREEERRRLRRDLHDGLGPQLSSQTLTIDAVRTLIRRDPDSAEALLLDLKAQAQDAISDIRRLVYELRPPALDDLGFVAALGEIGARQRQGGLDVSILVPESLPLLPAAVEVAAYHIVQEAITNVVRHAETSVCFVSLEVYEDVGMLRLEVRDDGRGIGVNREMGVGLTSMRERAEELGGSFTVDALPGGGTIVRARLPLPEEG